MKPLAAILAGLALANGTLTLQAEVWPMFRGPTGQGLSAEKGVPREWSTNSNVRWRTPIPGEGWSSPVVLGQRVFVTAATEGGKSLRALCLATGDGKVVWDQSVLPQTQTRREERNSWATCTPAVDERALYVLSFNGHFVALDHSGTPLWTNRDITFYGQHGLATSLLLFEDLVIAAFDGSSDGEDKQVGWQKPWDKAVILAVDRKTGQTRWRGKRGDSRIGHATPIIWRKGAACQLISVAGDVVQGFDPHTGERLWSANSPGEGLVPSPATSEELVFSATGFGKPTILATRIGGTGNVTETHIVWRQKQNVPSIPSLLYVRPYVYALADNGTLICLQEATGEIVWRERLQTAHGASPVYADGHLYCTAEDGTTTVLATGAEAKVVARNALPGKCQASLAVSGGQLFIRTDQGLFCIGQSQR